MIVYTEEYRSGLEDYGILIPVRESKFRKTFDALRSHPVLGPREQEWHLEHSGQSITREDIRRAHTEDYVHRLFSTGSRRRSSAPSSCWIPAGVPSLRSSPGLRPLTHLLERTLYSIGGDYQCGRVALETGFCFYFGGGAHHAHPDYGKGFCLLNDIVIVPAQSPGRRGDPHRLGHRRGRPQGRRHRRDHRGGMTRSGP